MTVKPIESGATGILILILPVALGLVFVFTAWPLLLALLALGIAAKLWQQYQWKQWSQQVDPYFHQLIKENKGCLTPLDLSLKGNLTGSAAKRFLDKKAEEYGAQRKTYQDKGTVYYFLTASALGSIFDDSEPVDTLDSEAIDQKQPQQFQITSSEVEELVESTETNNSEIIQPPESSSEELELSEKPTNKSETAQLPESSSEELELSEGETSQVEETSAQKTSKEALAETFTSDSPEIQTSELIQAELASRLDVNASTVSKRKSDDDFAEWSQSRDPDGIAWKYSPETKMFIPQDSND